jgi:rhomboid protease GluP
MSEPRVHTWVTYALIAANIVMFGFELAMGVHLTNPTPQQLLEVGANSPPLTMNGEWWRLGSSMFLHFGLLHIALNMVCLWQGRIVEALFGRAQFLAIYVLAGLAGGVASLARDANVVSAGASGAVFGVYGAFGAFLLLRKRSMPEAVWQTTARGIGMFVVINLIFGLVVPSISMTAHIGGLVFGFLVGVGLLYRATEAPSLVRTAVVTIAGLALVVGALFVIPKPMDTRWLRAFGAVEEQVLDKARELEGKRKAGSLENATVVTALERDVLGPWRAGCTTLAATEPAERYQRLFAALVEYCAARQASWDTLVAALRATGDEQATLLLHHNFQEVEIRKLANEVTNAQKALDP